MRVFDPFRVDGFVRDAMSGGGVPALRRDLPPATLVQPFRLRPSLGLDLGSSVNHGRHASIARPVQTAGKYAGYDSSFCR